MTEGAVYLETFRSGELSRRVEQGLELLRSCRVCPRDCDVDRLADEKAVCLTGRHAVVASHFAHFGEEDCLRGLRGSGTIFFANCNLKCVFCQNFDISQRPAGTVTPPHRLAEMMLELQGQGCHNINFVTPEHVVPQALEALPIAIEGGLRVPLVYNTSGYDSLESLRLLDGVVDVYMPDFKFWDSELARRYRKAENYCLGAQLAISVHNCPVLADTRFPMSIFKRTQRKYVKKVYRVRNWREYEAGLRNRGSLTVWISLTAGKLVNWDAPRPRRRKPGRQRKYSNHAIETAVTLGMVFHLSSRQSEGLLRSLFALMKLDNDVPDHTTISRRKPKLGKVPFYQVKQKTPLHILIDSSGLAVHAGQLRRAQKSRDYRKLHLCVDEQSGEVVAGELTSKRARDSSRVASLVGPIDSPISSARADTAYDAGGVYEAIENHSAHRSPRVLIPPRKGAQLASGPASSRQRNRNIAAQARLGKRKWHTESGYSKRSKVETTFHRYKAIVGSAMRARGLAAQRVEARIGCKILNTMTALGMLDSEMIG